jgi:sugar O-acyltransferase (sialic acid O-acetyltransferase NeuD family)
MTSKAIRVLGVGAGGHAKVVLEILAASRGYDVVGLLDADPARAGTELHGFPVLGGDELLERQYDAGVSHAFIGLGGAADTRPRRHLYERVRSVGFDVVSAMHPSAVISPSARIGKGATIAACAVVGPDVVLGENVVVNTGAVVDHDCRVGDHVHVAIGARIASGVVVEDGAHVGAGATVLQGLRVGAGSVVGAGAVVVHDVDPGLVVVGVPAAVLRTVGER